MRRSVQLRGDTALKIGTSQLAAVPYFQLDPNKPDEGVEVSVSKCVSVSVSKHFKRDPDKPDEGVEVELLTYTYLRTLSYFY